MTHTQDETCVASEKYTLLYTEYNIYSLSLCSQSTILCVYIRAYYYSICQKISRYLHVRTIIILCVYTADRDRERESTYCFILICYHVIYNKHYMILSYTVHRVLLRTQKEYCTVGLLHTAERVLHYVNTAAVFTSYSSCVYTFTERVLV